LLAGNDPVRHPSSQLRLPGPPAYGADRGAGSRGRLALTPRGPVVEIGAATPYYCPRRVTIIVDPADSHERVTTCASPFDTDLRDWTSCRSRPWNTWASADTLGGGGRSVQRGREDCARARRFLVTFPVGWNVALDQRALTGWGAWRGLLLGSSRRRNLARRGRRSGPATLRHRGGAVGELGLRTGARRPPRRREPPMVMKPRPMKTCDNVC